MELGRTTRENDAGEQRQTTAEAAAQQSIAAGRATNIVAQAKDSFAVTTLPWDHPDPFTLDVTPEPAHIDGLNHTNNAVYVQWCERVAWAHSAALGLTLADYQRLDRAMAIRQAHYDHLLPALLGEALTLGTWLLPGDGKLRMERCFQLLRRSDGATVLRGRWDLVCIELGSGRARRMPPEFLQAYLSAALPGPQPAEPGAV